MNFPSLQGNWVDLVIIGILAFFFSEGLSLGFWIVLADFLSFVGSVLISLRLYEYSAFLLRSNFSLSHSISKALGFLITAILIEALLDYLFGRALKKLPKKLWKNWWSKALGALPAAGEGLVLSAFILVLILGLPISPQIKSDISESKIGSFLLRQTTGTEKKVNEIFGGVIEDSLTYLTVRPESRERIPLEVARADLKIDEKAETEMFALVNNEREKAGLPSLDWATNIVPVARAHGRDMWERKYFSHISLEGEDVGDRLTKAGIKYRLAGENLALAPTVVTAHTGLMSSEGHRANILEPKFKKVGIGVVDNGVYGKMFVQVFTD